MTIIRTTRTKTTAPIATLLFVCQLAAGAGAPLAHAQEPERAPAAFEAHHDASCLVLHDEMRCALCHYANSRMVLQRVRATSVATTFLTPRPWRVTLAPVGLHDHLSAPPRAPPRSLT